MPTTLFNHDLLFDGPEYPDEFDPTIPVNDADRIRRALIDAADTTDDDFRHAVWSEVRERLGDGRSILRFEAEITAVVLGIFVLIREAFRGKRRGDAAALAAWLAGPTGAGRAVPDDRAEAALKRLGRKVAAGLTLPAAYYVEHTAVAVAGGTLFAASVAFWCPDESATA